MKVSKKKTIERYEFIKQTDGGGNTGYSNIYF